MKNNNNFKKVSGFNDKFSDEVSLTNQLDSKFFDFTTLWGYEKIDTPIIERSSIFSRKSGSSIGSNIYNFIDPSGSEVSLRADFTTSIIRSYIENELSPNEMRFSYSGEIYKYDSDMNKNYSHQNGVEFIGSKSLYSDLEIVAMAKLFVSTLLDDIKISIGHVGVLMDVIEHFQLSGRVGMFLLQNIDFIKNESSNDEILIKAQKNGIDFNNKTDESNSTNDEISKILDFTFHKDENFKQTRNDLSIVEGLKNKISKNVSKDKFFDCLDILRPLVNIGGGLEESISEANKILSKISTTNNLRNLYDLANNLNLYGIEESDVSVNFGLVREWGYYTGFVFNILSSENKIIGGGGRYDSLGLSFGENLSASGFAIDSEIVFSRLKENYEILNRKKILVYISDQKDLNEAIDTCKNERNKGNIVLLKSSLENFDEIKKWSLDNNISEVLFFENNKIKRSKV